MNKDTIWGLSYIKKAFSFQAMRYLFSGGTATFTNLGVFYLINSVMGVHYLIASGAAFLTGFVVSFTLHKFITFQDHSMERVHMQAGLYLLFWGFNILLGMGLLFALVEYLGIAHLFAQALTVVFVAVESFFVYRHIVFRHSSMAQDSLKNDTREEHMYPESQM
jgi:putative flippase GtrA